ncbi:glycosyltransferase involved in cell wall biosynthesis [Kineothrix alysoides]|uniref:Glycosyltransferase involved in cell wall biosynthesis n=1 Tax=Kineothrix alysoides TaxID=1469948 RepID=A0A4R1QYS2_9FIRM|nr:glycosyltransferase family 2 protein [Kineothrix alysoides]TCL58116.1 glycosyltransferase involved in cell wall biosynthesis [Kineothrix alysoides]
MISVIVPIYNIKTYLRKCIESILNQTMQDLDIVLVDDGSTDGCYEICDEFSEMDDRIIVIHKENGGLVSARKAGIRSAKGSLITWVDGDDWIEPDYIEKMHEAMIKTDADIVAADLFFDIGNNSKVVRNGIAYGCYAPVDIVGNMLYSGTFYEYGINPHIYTKIMKKELICPRQLEVDERIIAGEDAAVVYPCILAAKKVSIADICGYHYIQHPGAITKTTSPDELFRNQIFIEYMRNVFIKYNISDMMEIQLNQYIKYYMILRNIQAFDTEKDKVLIPYGGVPVGSNVVLYGAGGVGQQIYKYLYGNNKVEITGWLDKNFEEYQQQKYDVKMPEDIVKWDYDFVLIANTDSKVSNTIKNDLIALGVEQEKILWFSENFLEPDKEFEIKFFK